MSVFDRRLTIIPKPCYDTYIKRTQIQDVPDTHKGLKIMANQAITQLSTSTIAVYALRYSTNEADITKLIEAWRESESARVRIAIADVLSKYSAVGDTLFQALVEMLADDSEGVVVHAVEGLRRFDNIATDGQKAKVSKRLALVLQNSYSDRAVNAMLGCFEWLGHPSALPQLRKMVTDSAFLTGDIERAIKLCTPVEELMKDPKFFDGE